LDLGCGQLGWLGKIGKEKRERVGWSLPKVLAYIKPPSYAMRLYSNSSLKHPPISPSPMPRQGLKSGLQATIILGLWDNKDNALKWRIGPQSKIVEMPIGIDDLHEASRHITAACRQQDGAFSIAELALEVLNRWSCFADHHCLSKKVSDQESHHIKNVIELEKLSTG
jgi:hypothetical protein